MIFLKKATIKDVAQRANVSISTVSNTLNGVDVVKPDTRERILKAAKDLNYSPNMMGKQLRSRETNTIGIFTDSVAGPYFYTLVESISHALASAGYSMNVMLANDHESLINALLGNTCDGAIIFDHMITEDDLDKIIKQGLPTVMLDRPVSGPNLSSIVFDSYQEGLNATRQLIKLGHKRIAFLEGYDNNRDSKLRKAGFMDALKEADLDTEEPIILRGFFEEVPSFNSVKQYLHETTKPLVTAFLAGNDLSAIGTINALKDEGYEVPDDFSVIGFDDIEIAQYFHPALTTVRNPINKQGRDAVSEVLKMITGNAEGKEQVLNGKLMIRDSAAML